MKIRSQALSLFFVLASLVSFTSKADDLYRQKYDPKAQPTSAYNPQTPPPTVQGPNQPPEAQNQPPPKVEPKVEGELNSFFQEGPKKLRQVFQENRSWLAEKTKSGERAYVITTEILKIANDPEVQKAILDVAEKFRFKPLLLAEVLLLILTLVFRSTRSPSKSVFLRVVEQLIITNVYAILAVIVIPTAFLGKSYWYLLFNLTTRVLAIFYPNLGPVSQ